MILLQTYQWPKINQPKRPVIRLDPTIFAYRVPLPWLLFAGAGTAIPGEAHVGVVAVARHPWIRATHGVRETSGSEKICALLGSSRDNV